jgi:hypothetical protein
LEHLSRFEHVVLVGGQITNQWATSSAEQRRSVLLCLQIVLTTDLKIIFCRRP